MKTTTIFILFMLLAVTGLAQPILRTSWTTNSIFNVSVFKTNGDTMAFSFQNNDLSRGNAIISAQKFAAYGDSVVVGPGNFFMTNYLGKNGVNWFFYPGANLISESNSIFSDTDGPLKFTISGSGNFITKSNVSFASLKTFDFQNSSSTVFVDFNTISNFSGGSGVGINVANGGTYRFNGKFVYSSQYDAIDAYADNESFNIDELWGYDNAFECGSAGVTYFNGQHLHGEHGGAISTAGADLNVTATSATSGTTSTGGSAEDGLDIEIGSGNATLNILKISGLVTVTQQSDNVTKVRFINSLIGSVTLTNPAIEVYYDDEDTGRYPKSDIELDNCILLNKTGTKNIGVNIIATNALADNNIPIFLIGQLVCNTSVDPLVVFTNNVLSEMVTTHIHASGYYGNGSGLTNLPFAKTFTSTNGFYTFTVNTDGSTNVDFVVTNIGQASVPSGDIPNTYVTNNNNGALVQTIAGTNKLNGSLSITNGLFVGTPATFTNSISTISNSAAAVTVGASAFLFTNKTPANLRCFVSGGSAVVSVGLNGTTVAGSLTGLDYLIVIAPNEYITLTYSVATPNLFTNRF